MAAPRLSVVLVVVDSGEPLPAPTLLSFVANQTICVYGFQPWTDSCQVEMINKDALSIAILSMFECTSKVTHRKLCCVAYLECLGIDYIHYFAFTAGYNPF